MKSFSISFNILLNRSMHFLLSNKLTHNMQRCHLCMSGITLEIVNKRPHFLFITEKNRWILRKMADIFSIFIQIALHFSTCINYEIRSYHANSFYHFKMQGKFHKYYNLKSQRTDVFVHFYGTLYAIFQEFFVPQSNDTTIAIDAMQRNSL